MELWVVVELALVVAGGGDDSGVLVGPDVLGLDPWPWEIGDFGFWPLVVPIVGLTAVFGLAVG